MLNVVHGPALAFRICEGCGYVNSECLVSVGNLKNSRRVIQILFLLTTSRHFKKPVGNENKRSPLLVYFVLISHHFCRDDMKINEYDVYS